MRCGCKPCASQIRWTVDFPTPWAFAIVRTDQCVASFGVVYRVASTISFTLSACRAWGLEPCGASTDIPAGPWAAKRCLHWITVGRDTLSCLAMEALDR